MTEKEWQKCADPKKWTRFLREMPSKRKLRLLACACCQRMWPLPKEHSLNSAVEVAERLADGKATESELVEAFQAARAVYRAYVDAVLSGQPRNDWSQDDLTAAVWADACGNPDVSRWLQIVERSRDGRVGIVKQVAIIRDIIGDPFRPVAAEPSWQTSTVVSLAQAIYEERAFDRMPILADALEDAGCTSSAILDHCRSSGEHVRGCWVVDSVLGKT